MRRRPYINPSEPSLLHRLGLPGVGPGTRASDADRERAADTLRRHHVDGRLSTSELDERTGRAYAATTLGELDEQFEDVPRLRSPEAERQPRRLGPPRPAFALPLIALLLALVVVASAHALLFVWPLMLFLFLRPAFVRRRWWGRGWPEPYRRY